MGLCVSTWSSAMMKEASLFGFILALAGLFNMKKGVDLGMLEALS